MSTINCKFYFLKGEIGRGTYPTVASALDACIKGNVNSVPMIVGDYKVQLEHLAYASVNHRKMIYGIVKKFDINHTPKVGIVGQTQTTSVNLAKNQWLIHNSHFLLDCRNDVLLYHKGRQAVPDHHYAKYLQNVCGQTIAFHDVLDKEAYRKLHDRHLKMKKVSLRYAIPTNINMADANLPELEGISGMGGHSAKLEIRGDARKVDQSRRHLSDKIMPFLQAFAIFCKEGEQEAGGIVEFEGCKPVDLIADRLCVEKSIQVDRTDDKSPDDNIVLDAMKDIMVEKTEDIDEIFGSYE